MALHAYLFEVRSIQPFLFATGKLRHMVAGSELIDYLCDQPLKEALEVCGLEGYESEAHSPRCAGGAFYLLIEDCDKAQRFRRLWPLLVSQLLPGVEQVDALVDGESARGAIRKGLEELRVARNRPAAIRPVASPYTQRSPRTGQAAVHQRSGESIDEATLVKMRFRRPDKSNTLAQRFSSHNHVHWPDNFEADADPRHRFPLTEGDRVALVHIDGNGLGEILRLVNEAAGQASDRDYIALYRRFSDGLERATIEACRIATDAVLIPEVGSERVVPARPLVLGGDDLTVLTRADLALPFTERFIDAFEAESTAFLTDLRSRAAILDRAVSDAFPDKLTACAGVTFIKPSQPFAQCYGLAESLCDRAKEHSRHAREKTGQALIPSSVAFHRVHASLIEDANTLFDREMRARRGQLALALPAYALGSELAGDTLPLLSSLKQLAACFGHQRLNEKRLRSLATLLHLDPDMAAKDYQRWKALAERDGASRQYLHTFEQWLEQILGPLHLQLPASEDGSHSILADLLCYLSVSSRRIEDTEAVA